MEQEEAALVAAVASFRDAEAKRAQEMARRDLALMKARDAGVPWSRLQRLAGMTAQGVANALKRAEKVS